MNREEIVPPTDQRQRSETRRSEPTGRRTNAERSAGTQAQIIEAAIRILVERGFAALSNAQIIAYAGVSSGALMHQYASRATLLNAVVTTGYGRLTTFRAEALEKLPEGLPRFRAVIDLAWRTARMPEGIAVNEVRIGSRSDPECAKATASALTHIAEDYGRFVARLTRRAGLSPTQEVQGLWAATALAVRSLAIDGFTYPSAPMQANLLLALRTLREDIIAKQLGEQHRQDPSIVGLP